MNSNLISEQPSMIVSDVRDRYEDHLNFQDVIYKDGHSYYLTKVTKHNQFETKSFGPVSWTEADLSSHGLL